MNQSDLDKRIREANDLMVSEVEEEETVESPSSGVDVFEEQRTAIRGLPKPKVKGASRKVVSDLNDLLERGVDYAYKKALDDSESLRAEGETARANIVLANYMNEWYRPTVDALIRLNSVEEVLASQEALAALDALVALPGQGRGDQYTAVYVSSLYEPTGSAIQSSDAEVLQGIRNINHMLDNYNTRAAVIAAAKLQQSIDMGNNRATPSDYEFLQKIVLRGQ